MEKSIAHGTIEWHALSREAVLKKLGSTRSGLTDEQARRRRSIFGRNRLPREKAFSLFFLFLHQFKSALIYILVGASFISFLLNDFVDAYVILAAVGLNVAVGFFQEWRAQNALARLKKVVTFYASVKRNGTERQLANEELVPGDIVLLQAGNNVPADIRLIKVSEVSINESSLTGESMPVEKTYATLPTAVILPERKNMAFMGTTVVSGTAEGVVVATGTETEIGKIATLIRKTEDEQTTLQKKLTRLSKTMGFIILLVCLVIFLVGYALGYDVKQIFTTAVAIAVAAIPEGLVVIVTVILAIGMQRILREKALVRRLIAAETLGSTTVICTDKTGTLTEGDMRVVRIVTHEHDFDALRGTWEQGISEHAERSYFLALKIGMIASDASIENPEDALEHRRVIGGNPTDKAIVLAASSANIDQKLLKRDYPRLEEIPFDPVRKFMVTLNEDRRKNRTLYFKGAPEIILSKAMYLHLDGTVEHMADRHRIRLENEYKKLSREGLRILAVGYKNVGNAYSYLRSDPDVLKDNIFVGFVGIKDPLRHESKQTIEECKQAGIRPVILTGDHKLTALAIARELDLPHAEHNVIEGQRFEKLDQASLIETVKDISVYARVSPRDKLRIVDAWQARGEVVAMTGDGINDAPALKSADIGVALGSGTDVAKETADMVLLDNNFKTIVSAVQEGRLIYENIKKVILYLMSDSFTEMIIITISLFLGWPLPLLAAQILWINLVTDGFPNIALTVEPGERDIMKERPVSPRAPLLDKRMRSIILTVSIATGLVALALFYWLWQVDGDLARARTVVFSAVAIDSLFYVFSSRSLRRPIWKIPFFSNKYLILACLAGLGVQLLAVYAPFFQAIFHTIPLTVADWTIVFFFSVMTVFVMEITKWFFQRAYAKE